jgi:hypothetical protein
MSRAQPQQNPPGALAGFPTLEWPARRTPGTTSAVAGDGQATVTIVAPTTGGIPTSYTVTATPGGAQCTVTAPATSCVVSGLANGTSYTFSSTATNAGGTSGPSGPSNAVTPRAATPVPVVQTPAGGCVTAGSKLSIPRAGSKSLMRPGCKTNAQQRVGVKVRSATPRGDVRYYKLFCAKNGQQSKTRSAGYGGGYRVCKTGTMKIRTYGTPLRLKISWFAPATSTFGSYKVEKSYRS